MTRLPAAVLAFCLLAAGALPSYAASQAAAPEACRKGSVCLSYFSLPNGLRLPVYRSFALDKANGNIKRAVVVVHGFSRNARGYFRRMTRAAVKEGLENETLVIAPHFQIEDDDHPDNVKNIAYWEGTQGWKRGDLSSDGPKGRISSFAAMDALLNHLGDKTLFPNLAKLTIVGHSGGGQFVQRYAAGHPPIVALKGVRTRHVIANPARYMYLNALRPIRRNSGFTGGFAAPADAADCPDYNDYEYGLGRPNAYMARSAKEILIRRARQRDIVLLLGEADNDPEHKTLTRNCRAGDQGRHRLERGRLYKAHLDRYFAPHHTRLVTVPGVGHSSTRMFNSPQGRKAIFF